MTFRDNKEGLIGLRVARTLEQPVDKPELYTDANGKPKKTPDVDNTGVAGQYLSSEGLKGDAVWGTRGRWCILTGTVGVEPVTVAILDHPGNANAPTYWHARGYGLFAANGLGRQVFDKAQSELVMTLEPGKSVTYRYRVLVMGGTAAAGRDRARVPHVLGDGVVGEVVAPGEVMDTVGRGVLEGYLSAEEVSALVQDGLAKTADRRPARARHHPRRHAHDADAVHVRAARDRELAPRVAALDFLVALGTHAPMSDAAALAATSAGRWSTAAPASAASSTTGGTIPRRSSTSARFRRRDIAALTEGRLDRTGARRAEPARRRVRPRAHLRAGLSARSRRVLGRHEVPVSRASRRRQSSISRTGSAR